MRLLRGSFHWGLCPQTPGICRFFLARIAVFDFLKGTGIACPQPFRPLNRSLELLPSSALSRPAQVLPGWTTSTSPCNTFSTNGDYPLNFVSHDWGSLHGPWPFPLPFSQKRQPGLLQRTMRLNKEPGKTVERSGICWRRCLREAVSWATLSFISINERYPISKYAAREKRQNTTKMFYSARRCQTGKSIRVAAIHLSVHPFRQSGILRWMSVPVRALEQVHA